MYTSGQGDTMQPGNSCASCHGTLFSLAGTLYPTAHESTNCDGVNVTGAIVTITGADGNTLTMSPNSVGNFETSRTVVMPFTAVVSYNGVTNAMTTPQKTGDCNSCHTQSGANGAPGRIVLP
jgi:hypothetical protein